MTASGVASLETSDVRIYFYANKVDEKLAAAPNGFYKDPATGTIYILLGDKNSVMIESNSQESELVNTIAQTIHMEQ